MLCETAVQWYRFTCLRCATTWTTRYSVRQVVDASGGSRSFYRLAGFPCEDPTAATTVCPACRHSTVRADLVRHTAVGTVRLEHGAQAAWQPQPQPQPQVGTVPGEGGGACSPGGGPRAGVDDLKLR